MEFNEFFMSISTSSRLEALQRLKIVKIEGEREREIDATTMQS